MIYKQWAVDAVALRTAMNLRQMSATNVASLAGVSLRHIQGLLQGKRTGVTAATAAKIAKALDVDVNDLVRARTVTTVSIPLHGVGAEDPRIDGLLDLVEGWAENNEIQCPVYTVETRSIATTSHVKETL